MVPRKSAYPKKHDIGSLQALSRRTAHLPLQPASGYRVTPQRSPLLDYRGIGPWLRAPAPTPWNSCNRQGEDDSGVMLCWQSHRRYVE
jgi:hypothetical protein